LAATGKVEISLPDDDVEALTILLNAMHARSKLVPLEVNLNLLTQIAVLVDKYRLHDVVALFADMWVKHAESQNARFYFMDISQWLCISCSFRNKELFSTVTQCAIVQSKGNFTVGMADLPMPRNIIGAITPYYMIPL